MPLAIAVLQADISDYHPEIEIIGTANGVMAGAKMITKLQPQFIFLDIHMGDGDGFDLLEIIADKQVPVVMTTASSDHAIKAFQFEVTDYLLKPIDPELLTAAINKVKAKITTPQTKISTNTVSLNTQEEIRVTDIADVMRLEAMGNYTTFYFHDGTKMLVTKTMKDYSYLIEEHQFMRVHQSHIVNRSHIKAYIKTEGGYLLLKDGSHVPVSVRKKSEVMEMLK